MQDFHNLLTLMVVVWVAGKVFRALNLPVIFGELLGGIIVGPLILNLVDPGSPTITVLAELGVFFLMLHAGLETNPKDLFQASKKALLISILSIIAPFGSIYLAARHFGIDTDQALFLGIGLSFSAISILARILKDYKLLGTKIGNIAMGSAVLTDIIGLMVFSVVINIIKTGSIEFEPLLFMIIKLFLFFGIVIFGGLKLSKYAQKMLRNKGFTFALIVALALGSIAELIGLHMIIGAFLAGLFIREEVLDEKTFNKIEDRIFGLSYSFLGPIFFASLAFHIDFSIITQQPKLILILLTLAIAGKLFGSFIAARIQKIPSSQSLLIGVVMNSRGAVDLVVASIGLNLGIINETTFSTLVIVIFAATFFAIFATKPLVKYAL